MKFLLLLVAALFFSCTDADLASRNLSQAADMFELNRRIVFYDAIQGEHLLVIEGRCSLTKNGDMVAVTCKTGPKSFKKHYLGLSDNVTFFSEQTDSSAAEIDHYRVILKPSAILPEIETH